MTLAAKNSYNSGDLITFLAGLNALYQRTGTKSIIYQVLDLPAFYYDGAEHPIKNSEGTPVCMNNQVFEMMRPLLLTQDYIEDYVVFEGQHIDINFDDTRDRKKIPIPYGNIHHWAFFIAPELACDLSKAWISNRGFYSKKISKKNKGKLIINRTSRYHNVYIHYFFLNEYEERAVFVGTDDECADFNKKWGLKIKHSPVSNFAELAATIHSGVGFLGNQSFCWHLADAMKVPRVLEYCPQFPNCHPTGANGYAFLYQEALELYVKQIFEA